MKVLLVVAAFVVLGVPAMAGASAGEGLSGGTAQSVTATVSDRNECARASTAAMSTEDCQRFVEAYDTAK